MVDFVQVEDEEESSDDESDDESSDDDEDSGMAFNLTYIDRVPYFYL